MISKFDSVYKSEYFRMFEEAAPLPNPDSELPSPEQTATPKDVPEAPAPPEGGAPSPEGTDQLPADPADNQSMLPDPREQETVTIDLLNNFIDFVNMPQDEQQKFLKDYGFLDSRVNSDNYKDRLESLKAITKSDFPKRTD